MTSQICLTSPKDLFDKFSRKPEFGDVRVGREAGPALGETDMQTDEQTAIRGTNPMLFACFGDVPTTSAPSPTAPSPTEG